MKLEIEFKYFDKSSCGRCKATDKAIQKSLSELKSVTNNLKLSFKETLLPASQIHLSPSITINGEDVEQIVNRNNEFKKSLCNSCCALIGKITKCRSFSYKGKKYDYIPKEMIMEAIQKKLR